MLTHDLARENLLEMEVVFVDFGRNSQDAFVRNDTDFGVFQSDDVTRVDFIGNAVQADQFTGHMEVRHLFSTVTAHHGALQKAQTDGVDGIETVTSAEEGFATADALAGSHEVFQAIDFFQRQSERNTMFTQIAMRAGNSQRRNRIENGRTRHNQESTFFLIPMLFEQKQYFASDFDNIAGAQLHGVFLKLFFLLTLVKSVNVQIIAEV